MVVKELPKLPRNIVESTSLEILKSFLDMVLGNLLEQGVGQHDLQISLLTWTSLWSAIVLLRLVDSNVLALCKATLSHQLQSSTIFPNQDVISIDHNISSMAGNTCYIFLWIIVDVAYHSIIIFFFFFHSRTELIFQFKHSTWTPIINQT